MESTRHGQRLSTGNSVAKCRVREQWDCETRDSFVSHNGASASPSTSRLPAPGPGDHPTACFPVRLVSVPHRSGIVWYLSFCVWILSLNILSSRLIHVVTNVRNITNFFDCRARQARVGRLPLMPPSPFPGPLQRKLCRPHVACSYSSPRQQLWPIYARRVPLGLSRCLTCSEKRDRPKLTGTSLPPAFPLNMNVSPQLWPPCTRHQSTSMRMKSKAVFVQFGNKACPTPTWQLIAISSKTPNENLPIQPVTHRTWDMITSGCSRQLRFKVTRYKVMHDWRSPSTLGAISDFLENKVPWAFLASGWIRLFYKLPVSFQGRK